MPLPHGFIAFPYCDPNAHQTHAFIHYGTLSGKRTCLTGSLPYRLHDNVVASKNFRELHNVNNDFRTQIPAKLHYYGAVAARVLEIGGLMLRSRCCKSVTPKLRRTYFERH